MSTFLSRYILLSHGWWADGHPHQRDTTGFCGTCGARPREPHYRCVPKPHAPEHELADDYARNDHQ